MSPQELAQDESLEEWWCFSNCGGTNIEDLGWHKGGEKWIKHGLLMFFLNAVLILRTIFHWNNRKAGDR